MHIILLRKMVIQFTYFFTRPYNNSITKYNGIIKFPRTTANAV